MLSKLFAAFVLICACRAAQAQSIGDGQPGSAADPDVDSCRAAQEIRDIGDKAKAAADPVPVFRRAVAEHPDSLFLNVALMQARGVAPGSLSEEYKKKLDAHPGEALYLFLYGKSLIGAETSKAIDLLHQALAKDPRLVSVHEALMSIYSTPRFNDSAKLSESMRAYSKQCPAELGLHLYIGSVENLSDLRELTAKLRHAVDQYPFNGVVGAFPNLWRAESRVNGSSDLEQIRRDMDRVRGWESVTPQATKVLIQGYRLLGDNAAAAALEGKANGPSGLIAESNAWFNAHGRTFEAMASDDFLSITGKWIKDYPNNADAWFLRFEAVGANERTTPEQVEEAGAYVLGLPPRVPGPSQIPPRIFEVLETWLARGVRLDRCATLAQEAREEMNHQSTDDRMGSGMMAGGPPMEPNLTWSRTQTFVYQIEADRRTKDFAAAHAALREMRRWIESDREFLGGPGNSYHLAAAALAVDEGKVEVALDEYRQTWRDSTITARARGLWVGMGRQPGEFESWWGQR